MVDFSKNMLSKDVQSGDEEKKVSSKNKKGRKKMDLGVKAIVDNIVFNKSDQWAYYKLSNTVFDFLSSDAKMSMAQQLINAFTNLMAERQDPLDCHLIITSTPVNIEGWEDEVRKSVEMWNVGPGFDDYIRKQAEFLREEEFVKKVTYLGINIGKRGALPMNSESFFEAGLKGAGDQLKIWLGQALKVPTEEISLHEEKDARKMEEEYFRTISTGNLQGERCTAEELLLLIKRQFYPAMPTPYLNVDYENRLGPGDLEFELGSAIFNKLRWLEINQFVETDMLEERGQELTGYRAALTVSKLPKQVNFPYESVPFMYFMHKLSLPFTWYSRFTLHPVNKMKKKLEGKKKVAKDELENYAAGGGTVDSAVGSVPVDIQEALQDMNILNEMLALSNTPWVEGTYRVIIETPDEITLKKYVTLVKQRFADIDVHLQWSIGDQAQIFLEQMPGDKLRETSHRQMTDLNMLGTSGFIYSSDVGDETSSEEKRVASRRR